MSAVTLRYSEQVDALLALLWRAGETIAGRVGRGASASTFAAQYRSGTWPREIADNFRFTPPDEVYLSGAVVDASASPAARVVFAETETEPRALAISPTFTLRQHDGWLVAFVLDERLDVATAEGLNAALALALNGRTGSYTETVASATAIAQPGITPRTLTRSWADPTRHVIGVPGCSRVSLFGLSPRHDSPRIEMTQFTGTKYNVAALVAAIERS